MKWLFAVPVGLLGLVLLAVGATAAIAVGPDDTIYNKAESVGDGSPVVTDPDVLSWERLHLHVRAESDGEVFIGAGNPVDVRDYTADAAHSSVDSIGPLGVDGRDWRGDGLPATPDDVDFWTDDVSGSGTQTMTLDVDGEPVQILIAPVGKDPAPVDVAFGVTVDGLFGWSIIVAGTGLLLLLLALGTTLWSRRRARKRAARAATYPSVPPPPIPPPPAHPPVTSGNHVARRTRLVAPIAALLLLGTGCSAIPEPVAYDEPTKVPLTDEELDPVWAEIDRRLAKATRATGPPKRRHEAWSDVFAGSARRQAIYHSTALELEGEEGVKHSEGTARAVYTTPQSEYPLWAILSIDDGRSRLAVIRKNSVVSDWMIHAIVSTFAAPRQADAVTAPSDEELDAGSRMMRELRRYWQSGAKPSSVDPDDSGKELTQHLRKTRRRTERRAHIRTTRRKVTWDKQLTSAPVEGGTLYLSELEVTTKLIGNGPISWNDGFDRLNDQVSPTELRLDEIVTVAVIRYDDGDARVISASMNPVPSTEQAGSSAEQAAHPTPRPGRRDAG